jgi:bacillithiol biosynthesis cysteine-adding enzyme BshC
MDYKTASKMNRSLYNEQTISFSEIPGQSNLFIDFQSNSDKLNQFYPTINSEIKDLTSEVLANYKINRNELCDILLEENRSYEVGEKTVSNIERLRQEHCVTVITGQQAGLFSGPIYTIYKALSAIKLADELSESGINTVPIFWIASEDHDFDEISKTTFIGKENELIEVSSTPKKFIENRPVGYIEIDDLIEESKNILFENGQSTEFTGMINKLIDQCYVRKETYSSSFGKLLASIFKDYGLIFVSPLNERLRHLSSPVFQEAVKNAEVITGQLLKRNDELKANGYHSQVLVEEDYFPFFYIDKNKKRHSLRVDKQNQVIRTQDSSIQFSQEELLQTAIDSPINLSPNALMRPIVQDFLFPTVCYYGGGAEIAYFGQNSVIYEALRRPVTPIRHRSSFTIITGKHRRTMEKYSLEYKDLFNGEDEILASIVDKYINTETANVFKDTENLFNEQLNKLKVCLEKDEITLAENLVNRKKTILWHISTLENKFHQAEIRKNEVIHRRIQDLFTELLPFSSLQERSINAIYFLNLYGENFLEWIYNSINSEEKNHQIIIF